MGSSLYVLENDRNLGFLDSSITDNAKISILGYITLCSHMTNMSVPVRISTF